jgi:hypothetical protein
MTDAQTRIAERLAAAVAAAALAAGLAACTELCREPPGANRLITNPAGTVDTTHGVEGAQNTPC